jgi:hypothetical protein
LITNRKAAKFIKNRRENSIKIIHINNTIDDKERSELLFSGHLLVYRQRESMSELIEFTKNLLKEHLHELDPVDAQQQLNKESFLKAMGAAQTQFRCSEQARQLFFRVLVECGVDPKTCYYDHFPLRVVPFAEEHQGAGRAAIGHHRDTWGSNINSQQNWWAPIFDLTTERTIALYPDYWEKPLANTTASWCFKKLLEKRNQAPTERSFDYPSAPIPMEEVNEEGVVKVLIQPGDVLNFASAQLHASVPNTSSATRFSVEMRTVNVDDLKTMRQAPNVDNAGTEPMYSWFKHIETKQVLAR